MNISIRQRQGASRKKEREEYENSTELHREAHRCSGASNEYPCVW